MNMWNFGDDDDYSLVCHSGDSRVIRAAPKFDYNSWNS